MKHILTILLALTIGAVAQTQRNPLSTANNGDINRNVKVPSGKSLTVEGNLTLASGATVNGLSAVFKGAGFATIDGVRTDGSATAGTHLTADARFITFLSTGESVSGALRRV